MAGRNIESGTGKIYGSNIGKGSPLNRHRHAGCFSNSFIGKGSPLCRHRHAGCSGGFTLVEVVVAVCILLTALIPMSALFTGSFATSQRAMALSQGQNIARDKMEEIISQSPLEPGDGSLEIPAQPPYPAYRIDYQLQAAESADAVMEIVVQVSWGRATDENTFTLATFSPAD